MEVGGLPLLKYRQLLYIFSAKGYKMKVVINKRFGGFSLSKKAYEELGIPWDKYGYAMNEDRVNPKLVEAVEKLGDLADGQHASLSVVEIPDGIEWEIDEYDGMEYVVEKSRSWG